MTAKLTIATLAIIFCIHSAHAQDVPSQATIDSLIRARIKLQQSGKINWESVERSDLYLKAMPDVKPIRDSGSVFQDLDTASAKVLESYSEKTGEIFYFFIKKNFFDRMQKKFKETKREEDRVYLASKNRAYHGLVEGYYKRGKVIRADNGKYFAVITPNKEDLDDVHFEIKDIQIVKSDFQRVNNWYRAEQSGK